MPVQTKLARISSNLTEGNQLGIQRKALVLAVGKNAKELIKGQLTLSTQVARASTEGRCQRNINCLEVMIYMMFQLLLKGQAEAMVFLERCLQLQDKEEHQRFYSNAHTLKKMMNLQMRKFDKEVLVVPLLSRVLAIEHLRRLKKVRNKVNRLRTSSQLPSNFVCIKLR